jgi:electron transfer flavoprotein beta subunit
MDPRPETCRDDVASVTVKTYEMNIIALIKQVPDTAQLSSTVDGLQLMQDGQPRIVNPWDEYTLETAIQLKEAHSGKVTVLTIGKPEAAEALKTGLAMGADEAILISDPATQGGDSLATARVLVAAIQKLGVFDIVVAGRASIDENHAATAVQVAALLNVPPISNVAELTVDPGAGTLAAVRLLETGRETVSSTLPAVVTVVKEIYEPRYPTFIGIRKAAGADIPTWRIADLGLEAGQVGAAGSQMILSDLELPAVREASLEMIEGEPDDAARSLVDRLIADQVV